MSDTEEIPRLAEPRFLIDNETTKVEYGGPVVDWGNPETDRNAFPRAGLSMHLTGPELWFGDKTTRATVIMFDGFGRVPELIEFLTTAVHYCVTLERIELRHLPDGWTRIATARGVQLYP